MACVPAQSFFFFFFFSSRCFDPSAVLSEVHSLLLVLGLKCFKSDSPCVWMHVFFFFLAWFFVPEEAFSQLKLAAEKS